jgi:SAM-dependent methyltransferase
VLDLACGTGQIAFGLAAHVGTIVAVDQEPGFVAYGRAKAERLGVGNVDWREGAAEDVALDGRFDLVAIGNAFHRLRRDVVAEHVVTHLAPGGCVALLWGDTPWNGDADWEVAYHDALEHWQDEIGARDRVPAGWQEAIDRDPHAEVLRRAGLVYEGERTFPVELQWTVESLVGLTYSTSFLSRAVLGDRAADFDRDLRDRLLASRPDGRFDHELAFGYELARKVS